MANGDSKTIATEDVSTHNHSDSNGHSDLRTIEPHYSAGEVYAMLGCPHPDDEMPCVGGYTWCTGPGNVDLNAAMLGTCELCVAIAEVGPR